MWFYEVAVKEPWHRFGLVLSLLLLW